MDQKKGILIGLAILALFGGVFAYGLNSSNQLKAAHDSESEGSRFPYQGIRRRIEQAN